MSTNVVMRLECPHCAYSLCEAVSLIRPHGSAYCPACSELFVLDPEIEAMSRLLVEAKAARRERKRRRRELQQTWREAAPPPQPLMIDILQRLDEFLAKLETELERA